MSHYILIRESRLSDLPKIGDVVRGAYLSNVNNTFFNALFREITLQLVVSIAAILFIFVGIPFTYCICAVPMVLIFIYAIIYSAFYMKSLELMDKNPLQCWVAEACQPFLSLEVSSQAHYRIITEQELINEGIEVGHLQRRIVGTISISNFQLMDESAWLFRLAVDRRLRHKGIGHTLIETAKIWCKQMRYQRVLLVISECQENMRQLFVSTGFQMKQMYHKQLLGNALTLLMYQLECDLNGPN